MPRHTAAVIGGGPAGLMAAESLARAGVQVELYDAMPSVGRKFLQAGVGGLNLTHSEPLADFLPRYGARRQALEPLLAAFGPAALREWAAALGVTTFIGSSGRIFPKEMKAAPLLRAWQKRLRDTGVRFHLRHRWQGWDRGGGLRFATPAGESSVRADATVLALGGGSWSKLGSDGAWMPLLAGRGVQLNPLMPANCGFDTSWSEYFRERHAGAPVKSVVVESDGHRQQGEFIVSVHGVEGGLIYALSAPLRDSITRQGKAVLYLDLTPGRELARLTADLAKPRGAQSMANHIRKQTGLEGVKVGLLRELAPKETFDDPARLGAAIKHLPLMLMAPRPLDEAISTAGGVMFEALDGRLMLRALPGVFCAGEMLDWEAPTGGYLLTACFATGHGAGAGAADWLGSKA